MYDDLARTQRPTPVEWFVVNALIPTVLVTFALQIRPAAQDAPPSDNPEFGWLVVEEPWVGGPIPDRFPVLIAMPRADYPRVMRRGGIEGYVRLKALVDARGRVVPSSMVTLHATDLHFVEPARKALADAAFRPAWSAGARIAYWVTITIEFRRPPRACDRQIHSKERDATRELIST